MAHGMDEGAKDLSGVSDLPAWRKAFLPAVIEGVGGFYAPEGRWISASSEARRFPLGEAEALIAAWGTAERAKAWLRDYIEIDLDLPPSVNELFVPAANRKKGSGRQRVKTERYKAWITAAGWQLKAACTAARARLDPKDPPFASNFGLWLRLDTDHRSDITNRIKAIEDLFVAMGLTTGDQWNDRCTVERDRTIPEGKARIVVYLIPENET